jgi:hypothetical protein
MCRRLSSLRLLLFDNARNLFSEYSANRRDKRSKLRRRVLPAFSRQRTKHLLSNSVRDLQLHAFSGISEVAYVIGFETLQTRISVLAYNKARSLQRSSNTATEPFVQTANENAVAILITVLAMNRYHNIRLADHRKTNGFVEVSAGNVQGGVAFGLEPLKCIEGILDAGNGVGYLGCSRFYSSAVWTDDGKDRLRPARQETKIYARSLVLSELFKVVVFVGHGKRAADCPACGPFLQPHSKCSLAENDVIAVRRPHEEEHRQ